MEQARTVKAIETRIFGNKSRTDTVNETVASNEYSFSPLMAEKLWVVLRIVFGAVFLADGLLKWLLLAQGNLQPTVEGMYFTSPALAANWLALGILVGLGETFGGLFLMLGIFQRAAALWSAAVMSMIYIVGGFDGWYFGIEGKVDLGGDLTLVLVYLLLALVVPLRYGLSSHFRLPERLAPGDSRFARLVRAFVA